MAAARWPRTVGVRTLPGSLTRERVKFWAAARMRPSAKPSWISARVLAVGFAGDDGEGVDGGVLAVALVGVVVDLGEFGAFDERAGHEGAGQGFEMLVVEGVVLGEDDGELAEAAWFERADGGAGAFADLLDGEALGFAEADDEQAFGLESVGGVQEEGLAEGGFELTGADDAGGGVADGVRCGHEGDEGRCVFSSCDVHRKDGEQSSREPGSILKREASVHG